MLSKCLLDDSECKINVFIDEEVRFVFYYIFYFPLSIYLGRAY